MTTNVVLAPENVVARGGLVAIVKALARGGLKRVLPASLHWRFLAWRVGYFDPEVRLLRHLCDRTRASIDIGASIGSYTVHLLNHSAKCYAFEPRPGAAATLARRLTARPSPRLRVEVVALSDRAGTATLRVATADAGRSTIEAANALETPGRIEVLTVPMRRLDDYAGVIEPVGCIKIDVEGHEEAVLRGAANLLARDQPALIIEIEERHKPDSIAGVRRYLGKHGYRGFFFRGGRLRAIESFRLDVHQDPLKIAEKVGDEPAYINNFLFVAKHSLAKVRHLLDEP